MQVLTSPQRYQHGAGLWKNMSAGTRPRMKTRDLYVAFKSQKCSGKLKLGSSLPTHTTRQELRLRLSVLGSGLSKHACPTRHPISGLRCPVTAARRKRNGLENLVRKVPNSQALNTTGIRTLTVGTSPFPVRHVIATSEQDFRHENALRLWRYDREHNASAGLLYHTLPPTKQGSNTS